MGFNRTNPTLFYSRRIGRDAAGRRRRASTSTGRRRRRILGAAKLTGKTSRGWTVNFIDAVTAREYADTSTGGVRGRTEVEPFTNYLAARVRRDVGQRAGFGMLTTAVNRDLSRPGPRRAAAGSAVRRRRRRPPLPDRQARLRRHRAASRAAAWPDRTTSIAAAPAVVGALLPAAGRDAPHVRPGGRVAVRVEPPERLQQEQRQHQAQRVVLGRQPGLRGERRRVHDERRPDGRARGGGVPQADAGSLQPEPARCSSRSGTRGTSRATRWATATSRASTRRSATTGRSTRWRTPAGWVYSDRLTRGGPMMRAPGFTAVSASIEGDERKPVVWSVDGELRDAAGRVVVGRGRDVG